MPRFAWGGGFILHEGRRGGGQQLSSSNIARMKYGYIGDKILIILIQYIILLSSA